MNLIASSPFFSDDKRDLTLFLISLVFSNIRGLTGAEGCLGLCTGLCPLDNGGFCCTTGLRICVFATKYKNKVLTNFHEYLNSARLTKTIGYGGRKKLDEIEEHLLSKHT